MMRKAAVGGEQSYSFCEKREKRSRSGRRAKKKERLSSPCKNQSVIFGRQA